MNGRGSKEGNTMEPKKLSDLSGRNNRYRGRSNRYRGNKKNVDVKGNRMAGMEEQRHG